MVGEPAYLKAFKALGQAIPEDARLRTTEEEFYGESDRAAGILLVSMVEDALDAALKKLFRSGAPFSKLFSYEGPLGTFSAKIELGYALSLFGEKSRHDLDLLRRLRNGFAHYRAPLHFDVPEVKAVCEHLVIPTLPGAIPASVRYETGRVKAFGVPPKDHPKYPRFLFSSACHTLTFHLGTLPRRPHERPLSPLP
jgi:hypothetical protein